MESQNFYLGFPDFGLFRVEAVPWEAVLRDTGHSPRTTSERHRNRPAQCALRQTSREENWPGWTGSFWLNSRGKKYIYQLGRRDKWFRKIARVSLGYAGRKSERPKAQLEFIWQLTWLQEGPASAWKCWDQPKHLAQDAKPSLTSFSPCSEVQQRITLQIHFS